MLYLYELKKAALAPAIIGFAVLCLILNGAIVFSSHNDYGVSNADMAEMTDIFDDFDTGSIAERYIKMYALTGKRADNVRAKYDKLQRVVDEKGVNDDSLSPYFGENTPYLHRLLFKTLFGAISAEACLLALFVSLISTGYESTRNTEGVVCATRTGRYVLYGKLAASLTASGAFFVLVLAATLACFFARFDWSSVWDSNVSALFNSAVSEHAKPLITWRGFTVSEYLWACIGVAAALSACFCLLGFAIGAFAGNGYASGPIAVVLCALTFVVKPIPPVGGVLRSSLSLTPVWLCANAGDWFTDGYADVIWPSFEALGISVSSVALAAASFAAIRLFKKRNLS